jgi:hypothetical protein
MKRSRSLGLVVLVVPLVLGGCKKPTSSDAKLYEVTGKVESVAADKRGVTLEGVEMPGYRGAQKQFFLVAKSNLLDGLKPGDSVRGRVEVKGVKPLPTVLTLTELEKVP